MTIGSVPIARDIDGQPVTVTRDAGEICVNTYDSIALSLDDATRVGRELLRLAQPLPQSSNDTRSSNRDESNSPSIPPLAATSSTSD